MNTYFYRFLISLSLIALLFSFSSYAHMPNSINGQTVPSLAPMLAKVTPAIVNIAVAKKIPLANGSLENPNNPTKPRQSGAVGSGIIFDAAKGLIVTNAHVVDHAELILVTLKDGQRYPAKLLSQDDAFDIAIIQIHAPNLTSISFGNSNNLKVGDFVAAIGSPFGLTQTVTSGVISALNRVTPQIEGFQSFIQTDASINPGNSGGALVNLEGQVIGMNTAMVSPSYGNIGIGFAIPSNMVEAVITQLLKYGKVKRSMLGVVVQNISPDLAQALAVKSDEGVLVTKVVPNSPADKAGIRVEDIITQLNNEVEHTAAQLHNSLGLMRPGTKINLTVLRDHKLLTISAIVGDPVKMQQLAIPFINGMRLQDFRELEPDGSEVKGALVINLNQTSPAAIAGLEVGDVISSANGVNIDSVKDLLQVISKKPSTLLVEIARGNGDIFLVIQPQL